MLMDTRPPRGPSDRPWENEPDEAKWLDLKTGLLCMIRRGPLGNLCGYVRVPKKNPLYKARRAEKLRVHGGITYQGRLRYREGYKSQGWFVGFDCAHYMDLVPQILEFSELYAKKNLTYRDFQYVRAECETLAVQIASKFIPG